jgi:hypothetical protein
VKEHLSDSPAAPDSAAPPMTMPMPPGHKMP